MLRILCSTALCICFNLLQAQNASYRQAERFADSLYRVKNFAAAAPAYLNLRSRADFPLQHATALYNSACCYALTGQQDSALLLLKELAPMGLTSSQTLLNDADLSSLRLNKTFQELIKRIPPRPAVNNNPNKVKLVTSDINHFWQAYDLAKGDSAALQKQMRALYFAQATPGMQDYFGLKVSSVNYFIDQVIRHSKFHATVRNNTLAAERSKPAIMAALRRFKAIYPAAAFPDVYFVMGAFTSGGTVSDRGLLVGINQMANGPGVDVTEFDAQDVSLMNDAAYLPNIVAHELIHFQQAGLKSDTTNLKYAIVEGMADFLGELISGKVANPKLHLWMKGKEKTTWQRLKKEMLENNYSAWIANAAQVTANDYPDQGYWIGYQICRAYYEQAKDKKQAVHDMLHIQDYPAFLNKSGWDKKISSL